MNKKSQLQFIHQCSILLGAGVSLSEALFLIISMEHNKKKVHALTAIKESVEKGQLFSKSIENSIRKFDPHLLSVIAFGERAGILPLSLAQARDMREKSNTLRRKLIGSLIYPGFIALATVGMSLFLVVYIFPKIIPLFSSLNIKLPLLTRMVRALYELLAHQGFAIAVGVLATMSLFALLYRKNHKTRCLAQRIFLHIPILGKTYIKYILTDQMRSIGTLLECGQALPGIIEGLAESVYLEDYKKIWEETYRKTLRGVSLSTSLSTTKIIPVIVPNMISIGERTGSLSVMCKNIAHMYEQELDDFIKQVSMSIEPILMIVMGLVVGSIALSIILPIYEITNHLTR